MCSCSDSALEGEPEIYFVDESGKAVANEYSDSRFESVETKWVIVGVKVIREPSWDVRDHIKFIVRAAS